MTRHTVFRETRSERIDRLVVGSLMEGTRPPTWKILLAFAIIYFVWGSTFLAIRVGVREVPPFLLAAMRFLVAGLALYVWMIARGEHSPSAASQVHRTPRRSRVAAITDAGIGVDGVASDAGRRATELESRRPNRRRRTQKVRIKPGTLHRALSLRKLRGFRKREGALLVTSPRRDYSVLT